MYINLFSIACRLYIVSLFLNYFFVFLVYKVTSGWQGVGVGCKGAGWASSFSWAWAYKFHLTFVLFHVRLTIVAGCGRVDGPLGVYWSVGCKGEGCWEGECHVSLYGCRRVADLFLFCLFSYKVKYCGRVW